MRFWEFSHRKCGTRRYGLEATFFSMWGLMQGLAGRLVVLTRTFVGAVGNFCITGVELDNVGWDPFVLCVCRDFCCR
jgi:hypothetical protein